MHDLLGYCGGFLTRVVLLQVLGYFIRNIDEIYSDTDITDVFHITCGC